MIGVFESLRNRIVAANTVTSTNVFQIKVITDQIAVKNLKNRTEKSPESGGGGGGRLAGAGRVGSASGSEVRRVQARRRDMRDAPSPTEWWMRKIPRDSESEVLRLRRWSSHSGLERSRGVVVRWEM